MAVGQGGRPCVRLGSCTCLDACGGESSLVFTPYRPPRGGLKKMACGRQEAACATAGAGGSTPPPPQQRSTVTRGALVNSLRKEWLPLPPPLPQWRQVGPPPCPGRLCSSPPHPHRLWPHLHVEHLRCEPWPCLLEEKGSLLAGQGYLRSSPPARPGCGVTLCKAVMPPHPRNSRCSLELSIVEKVHAAE